ncbi:Aromatic-L-amino-acid decarboxylase [Lamellibrachia satsuma]|nr:Aromatic-L-amino-acid decarboxylase [Lamellibrachia satsuma]
MQKACIFGAIRFHEVETNDKDEMTGPALAKAIASDVKKGLIPFYCAATLGTTATCAFDDLKQIGTVCEKACVWLHVDAAYAGASFICPEFRSLLNGVEREHQGHTKREPEQTPSSCQELFANWAASTAAAGHRLPQPHCPQPSEGDFCQLLTCEFFVIAEERPELPSHSPFLIHSHWEIPLGRKFRSLKLWFVLRLYGVKGLQAHIRKHVELAREFEKLATADDRFQVTNTVTHGLVCFKLRQCSNELNELFLANLNKDRRVCLTACVSNGDYFLSALERPLATVGAPPATIANGSSDPNPVSTVNPDPERRAC